MGWSFAGTNLYSLGARQVTDLSGAQGMATPKGDNMEVPLRHGRPHRLKYWEQRRLTLGMVVEGASRTAFEDNLDALKALFSARTQKALTRTMGDGDTRSAQAEVVGALNITQFSPTNCKLTVDFLMADPFFYSTAQSTSSTTMNTASKSVTLTSAGSAPNYKPVILITGPMNNLTITNTDTGESITYTGTLAAGDTLSIDCGAYTATKTVSGVPSNGISTVSHAGAAHWYAIQPGSNALTMVSSAGNNGTVLITWYDAFH